MTTVIAALMGLMVAAGAWACLSHRLRRRFSRATRNLLQRATARRHRRILRKQWADALSFLGGGLKSGLTLEAAIDALVREAPEPLRSFINERWQRKDRWKPFDLRIAMLLPDDALALPRAALLLARPGGGRIGHLLETAAGVALRRIEAEERAEALLLPARISAWIVGLCPLALLALIGLLSPDYIVPLFQTAPGHGVLVTAGILVVTGLWLAHRLTTES